MKNPEIDFTNERYTAWIESLSVRYRESQIKAAVAVNTEMLKFYFGLGRDIVLMEKDQPWGSGFLKRVSFDLKAKMPKAEGFSVNNLIYMRCFFKLYASVVIAPQVEGKIGENKLLPQLGAKMDSPSSPQLADSISPQVGEKLVGFSSVRRRTTRWSSGRWNRPNNLSACQNTASVRFFQRRLRAIYPASPTSNPQ